ncbi:50S ribosomal protein L30 [Skermanella rosea]|nr:50S ribosomal protein L30 [Skermanella rosea]
MIEKGAIEQAPLVTVIQVKSTNNATREQRASVEGLGLRKIHQQVTHRNTPDIRGMINAVPHLVKAKYHNYSEQALNDMTRDADE